ncbi:BamA/TamA family outer membrane protein, partial [Sneathiella sp.]|uniref:BamA/TamA family outer membrane protein n=1 Tax=Sneathiella sp. TaxID=1964365 RepID=UPI00356B4BFB
VILSQRYNVGVRNFRGFANRGIGPRDIASGDALGGNAYAIASAELRFPVGLPQEYGVLGRTFIDVGTLTGIDDNDPGISDNAAPRASVGVGLNWVSPFGPIQINVAYPILKDEYDKDEVFQLDFGTRF